MIFNEFIQLLKDPIEFMLFDRNKKFIGIIHNKNEIDNKFLNIYIDYIICTPHLSIYLKIDV